jgi:HTH-type transcriptional regulator/antitoxin HigA
MSADPDYGSLLQAVQPRVIRDAVQHERALAAVERLMAEHFKNPAPAYEELIELLANLIQQYEDKLLSIPTSTPLEVLQHLVEERRLPKRLIAEQMGISPSHLSNILSGERQITIEHARNFGRVFGVSPRMFITL